MATSDVTIAQDGGQGNVKLHPYLVTLVRWCVSCLWSTATVLLHRLMTAPLQPITGPKPATSKQKPKRAAGTEHLHPEPKVECQLLHIPVHHTHDVIFVHGLYGSLGNTWRQGDWRPKYRNGPQTVTLRNHSIKKTCSCQTGTQPDTKNNGTKSVTVNTDTDMYNITINEEIGLKMREKLRKIIPQENDLITEKFYNNTLINQIEIVDNYETQANFVRDLFKKGCDKNSSFYNGYYSNGANDCYFDNKNCSRCFDDGEFNRYNNSEDQYNRYNDSDIKLNENNDSKTSNDEYKGYNESKRFYNSYNESDSNFNGYNDSDIKLNENNDSKTSNNEYKGYNESKRFYNSYNESDSNFNRYNDSEKEYNESFNTFNGCLCDKKQCEIGCGCTCDECYSTCWPRDWIKQDYPGARVISINYTSDPYLWRPLWVKENKRLSLHERAEQMIEQLLDMGVGGKPIVWVGHSKGGLFIKQIYCEAYEAYKKLNKMKTEQNTNKDERRTNSVIKNETVTEKTISCIDVFKTDTDNGLNLDNFSNNDNKCKINVENECKNKNQIMFDGTEEQMEASIKEALEPRACLWSQSKGFMFYSVPHRGSPLADIKTPVTARSVELLEISKDCPLVLDLQSRWLSATAAPRPPVRSFVETCRTLMSVLWLRIVSVDSADAGIGTLLGVSVDHREICKPSSRHCPLYTELKDLIDEALNECSC